jgi:hypothetical protein
MAEGSDRATASPSSGRAHPPPRMSCRTRKSPPQRQPMPSMFNVAADFPARP